MAKSEWRFYQGAVLNPKSDKVCDFYPKGLLAVQATPKSAVIVDLLPLEKGLKKYSKLMSSKNTIDFGQSAILPGFFDMHFHWVQDDVRQMPKDSLLGWLQKYTFPNEIKFSDLKYTKQKAAEFFKKLSAMGTLGGACYSSIHEHAVDMAMKEAKGDFVIGNVLMNVNSPKELTQTDQESIAVTRRLQKKFGTRHAFTPRFAITTSPKVMKEGSRLVDRNHAFKQTHLSENPDEIKFVLNQYQGMKGFEKVSSYTEIYEKTGMLGPRSLMGHGIHLSKKELATLQKTKTVIIHCPTSNAPQEDLGLGSGLFNFKKVENSKIRWALGSDIGGGPFLSMFDVMRSFVEQNAAKKIRGATYVKALYRATLAGAEILGLKKKCGNFVIGKEANFIVVPMTEMMREATASLRAESVLQKMVGSLSTNRKAYEKAVSFVSYRGTTLFQKK